MDEKTTKIIKERFDALPESIKQVFISSNYEETLLEIGKKYQLKVEQLGALETETSLVMMGLTPTKDFEINLTRELGIDTEKSSQIIKEINEKVFFRIRELLKLMNTPPGEEPVLSEEEDEIKNTGTDWNPLPPKNINEKTDKQILHSSGIEIISDDKKETLPAVEKLELSTTKGEVKPVIPEKKEEVHPVLAQKLTGFVKNDIKETEHALNNLTKTNAPVTPNEKPKIPSTDPYREIPE